MNVLKTIFTFSLHEYSYLLEEAFEEGWRLAKDVEHAPFFSGFAYQAHLLQEEYTVPTPKRTRAEILADARAAKAAKKDSPDE